MFRFITAVLPLLVSLSGFSATLTPEQRVATTGALTRAAYQQALPEVASNGHGFVALWYDARASHYVNWQIGALYATSLSPDGSVTSPGGVRLADNAVGRIASNGSEYLVAFNGPDGIYVMRLDDGGSPIAPSSRIIDTTDVWAAPLALVSNGSGYLLVTQEGTSGFAWTLLDLLGQPAGTPQTIPDGSSLFNVPVALVMNDGAYHVLYTSVACPPGPICVSWIRDLVIQSGGANVTRTLRAPGAKFGAVSTGDRIMLAWADGGELFEQLFDAGGAALTSPRKLALTPYWGAPAVAWDGSRMLISQISGDYSTVDAMRVNSDGDPVDASPFHVAVGAYATVPAHARGGARTALVWAANDPNSVQGEIFGRVVTTFDEVASAPTLAARLSNAPAIQRSPATVEWGSRKLTVFRSGDANGSIAASIDGGTTLVVAPENGDVQHDPDVAVIGNVALVAWRSDSQSRRRVLARRMNDSGQFLDVEPIVIDDVAATAPPNTGAVNLDRISVATDGQAFLVAWSGTGEVDVRRINPDGSALDPRAIAATPRINSDYTGVKAVWAGDQYVLAFAHQVVTPDGMWTFDLFGARVTSAGTPLDAAASHLLYRGGRLNNLSVAASGQRVVVAWCDVYPERTTSEVKTIELSAAAMQPSEPRLIFRLSHPTFGIGSVAAAARGETVAVTWSSEGSDGEEDVRAILLDRGDPFLVANADAYNVDVIATADGFAFTYARTDPKAENVAQLFTRELVISPRKRAVR